MVTSLAEKYVFDLEIVRSNEIPFFKRLFMPGFPSVEIDGTMVIKNRVVSEAELSGLIESRAAEVRKTT